MIRTGEWQYVCRIYGQSELYHLTEDPHELCNAVKLLENEKLITGLSCCRYEDKRSCCIKLIFNGIKVHIFYWDFCFFLPGEMYSEEDGKIEYRQKKWYNESHRLGMAGQKTGRRISEKPMRKSCWQGCASVRAILI